MSQLDYLNNEITAGAYVAYAYRNGNVGQMRVGQVESVDSDGVRIRWAPSYNHKNGWTSRVAMTDQLLVLPAPPANYPEVSE